MNTNSTNQIPEFNPRDTLLNLDITRVFDAETRKQISDYRLYHAMLKSSNEDDVNTAKTEIDKLEKSDVIKHVIEYEYHEYAVKHGIANKDYPFVKPLIWVFCILSTSLVNALLFNSGLKSSLRVSLLAYVGMIILIWVLCKLWDNRTPPALRKKKKRKYD